MENVDKDVAAMLQSLKRYDMLAESVAPVLGMKTMTMTEKAKPDFLDMDKDGDKKEPFKKAVHDKEKKEVDESKKEEEDEVDSEGGQIDEAADADVISWMNRFAKLGNMKGYGR